MSGQWRSVEQRRSLRLSRMVGEGAVLSGGTVGCNGRRPANSFARCTVGLGINELLRLSLSSTNRIGSLREAGCSTHQSHAHPEG
jgi:hypothetical protein